MSKGSSTDEWTFVNRYLAEFAVQIGQNENIWEYRFENEETGDRVLVLAEDDDEAWEKLADGDYREE